MQIWLPPSESKAAATAGPRLELGTLVFPELAGARSAVIAALEELGAGEDAARVLKLGAKSAAEADANLRLFEDGCAPALDLYTGVLFEALDAGSLTDAQARKLNGVTLVASGLFGFVRPGDLIPGHRLAMGVNLPPLGPLATWWRPRLEAAVGDLAGEVVFDVRSGPYRAACPAKSASVVELGVVRESGGERKVVSHMAKKWRGLAVRHLVCDEAVTEDAGLVEVLTSLEVLGENLEGRLEVDAPVASRGGGTVTRATLVFPPA